MACLSSRLFCTNHINYSESALQNNNRHNEWWYIDSAMHSSWVQIQTFIYLFSVSCSCFEFVITMWRQLTVTHNQLYSLIKFLCFERKTIQQRTITRTVFILLDIHVHMYQIIYSNKPYILLPALQIYNNRTSLQDLASCLNCCNL